MASIYDLVPSVPNSSGLNFGAKASVFNPAKPLSVGANYGFGGTNISSMGIGPKEGFSLGNIGSLGDPSKGGFFGNGIDLGFNAPTANLVMNGLGGIMQLLGANSARKAIEGQQRIAEENLAMTKKAYDTNIDRKYRAAAHQAGASAAEAEAAGNAALSRYGTGGLLGTSKLDKNTEE